MMLWGDTAQDGLGAGVVGERVKLGAGGGIGRAGGAVVAEQLHEQGGGLAGSDAGGELVALGGWAGAAHGTEHEGDDGQQGGESQQAMARAHDCRGMSMRLELVINRGLHERAEVRELLFTEFSDALQAGAGLIQGGDHAVFTPR